MDAVRQQDIVLDFVQYSVDEFFGALPIEEPDEVRRYVRQVMDMITSTTHIPVSCGCSQSYTLAKVATHYAKHYKGYHGICVLTPENRRKALSMLDIADVWGIGRKNQKKLIEHGIRTAQDFADCDEHLVQSLFSVAGVRTWQELRGQDVIDITELPMKQSITTSRTFANAISEQQLLEEQIANFCAHCARQLRTQQSVAQQLYVYAHTSAFRSDIEQHYLSELVTLPVATSNTQELISYALGAFRRAYRPGVLYKKAGVVLLKIIPETAVVPDLFDTKDRAKDKRLQRVLDHIDDRHGKHTILLGSQLTSQQAVYKTDHKSPLYTTDLRDIITIIAK